MGRIYYTELNLICILILLLFWQHMRRNAEQYSTLRMIFSWIIRLTIVVCLSDLVSGLCRGETFMGARFLNDLSNLCYFEALIVIGYLWMLYVLIQRNPSISLPRWRLILLALPLIGFTVLALSNPFTQILYIIDDENIYARNTGVFLHWICAAFYLLIPAALCAHSIRHAENRLRRQELVPLLYFIIAPIISIIIQILLPGVSTIQVGITISIAMICLALQSSQVLTDSLTGLNNRRGYDNYLEDFLQHHTGKSLTFLMLDLNDFKQINDKYGHMAGDRALQDAADALKHACQATPERVFLCRYGGDEFVIAGINICPEEIQKLESSIHQCLAKAAHPSGLPHGLSACVGAASGVCYDLKDAEQLLHAADKIMYSGKKSASAKH